MCFAASMINWCKEERYAFSDVSTISQRGGSFFFKYCILLHTRCKWFGVPLKFFLIYLKQEYKFLLYLLIFFLVCGTKYLRRLIL